MKLEERIKELEAEVEKLKKDWLIEPHETTSEGFWGRSCARLQSKLREAKEEAKEEAKRLKELEALLKDRERDLKGLGKIVREATEEVEILVWNLGGCETYALGYDLYGEPDPSMAKSALKTVRKAMIKAKYQEKVAVEALEEICANNTVEDQDGMIATIALKKLRGGKWN